MGEGRFATHVVAVEAAYDVPLIADTEGIGELAQAAWRLPALAQVAVVAQQAQKARKVARDVGGIVNRQAQPAAAGKKGPQRGIGPGAAEWKDRGIRIDNDQGGLCRFDASEKVRLAVETGVEGNRAWFAHRHLVLQPSSTQPS